jgi:hypothetical protein
MMRMDLMSVRFGIEGKPGFGVPYTMPAQIPRDSGKCIGAYDS